MNKKKRQVKVGWSIPEDQYEWLKKQAAEHHHGSESAYVKWLISMDQDRAAQGVPRDPILLARDMRQLFAWLSGKNVEALREDEKRRGLKSV